MITIFTPTYNRISLLCRLKKSLDNQTSYDFEWVIVDDGSTDGTEKVVRNWLKDNNYRIKYFKQQNKGKPAAFNLGVLNSDCEWFICVDSDDYLSESAVEIMNNDLEDIITKKIGIVYPRFMKNVDIFAWKEIDGRDIDIIDLKEKYGIVESAILMKKCFLSKYPFPLFKNEKFIQEGWLYQKLISEGKFIAHNKPFYISEYQPDGLTKNMWKLWANNSEGTILTLNEKYDALKKYTIVTREIARAKCIINLHTICFASNKNIFERTPSKIFSLVLYLPSLYFYKRRFG